MAGGCDALRAAVAALAAEDPTSLPTSEVADRLVELRRLIDGLEGVWSRLVGVLDGSGAPESGAGTGAWLRSACRLSAGTARGRLVLSRRLAERPAVGAALTAGEISVDHARLVTTALTELAAAAGPRLAATTEVPMLAAARRCDPGRLRREIAHARHALVPEVAAAADQRAVDRRRLDVVTTFDGTVVVNGALDPEGGEALLTALASLTAACGPDDTRTPSRRRADALIELCRQRLDAGTLPTLGGERPHLTVLVPVTALTGAGARTPAAGEPPPDPAAAGRASSTASPGSARDTATTASTAGPAEPPPSFSAAIDAGWAAGIGGIVAAETTWGAVLSPAAARRLACDASITRVVLAPASQPLDVGRRTRLIPPAIRTALTVRDRGRAYPGCTRPPPWTDAHHVTHWADGGPTSLDNLVLLCRTHHRTVHEGQSTLTRDRGGRWRIIPAGPAPPRAA